MVVADRFLPVVYTSSFEQDSVIRKCCHYRFEISFFVTVFQRINNSIDAGNVHLGQCAGFMLVFLAENIRTES